MSNLESIDNLEDVEKNAEKFAREAHIGQTYGEGKDFANAHLAKVVSIAKSLSDDPVVAAIAWQALYVKLADIIANMSNIETKSGDKMKYAAEKVIELKVVMDGLARVIARELEAREKELEAELESIRKAHNEH